MGLETPLNSGADGPNGNLLEDTDESDGSQLVNYPRHKVFEEM